MMDDVEASEVDGALEPCEGAVSSDQGVYKLIPAFIE